MIGGPSIITAQIIKDKKKAGELNSPAKRPIFQEDHVESRKAINMGRILGINNVVFLI
jgi:hypothetical protein